jgi:uncharacterized protein YkwD
MNNLIRYFLVVMTFALVSGCGGSSDSQSSNSQSSNTQSSNLQSKNSQSTSGQSKSAIASSKVSNSLVSNLSSSTTSASSVDGGVGPSAQEVLVVELINRARFDPNAEAAFYGIGLNDGIMNSTITSAQKKPLAHNLLLLDAARNHSLWMLDTNTFDHTGQNKSTPYQRMEAAGYSFTGNWASGENIAWQGTSGNLINLTSAAFSHHEGLFKSPGHRLNILNENYRELGVGQKQGYFISDGKDYLSSMLTENFARSGSNYYLTGVIYEDKNTDNFYDVGEGLPDIRISVNGQTYNAFAAGAYTIPLANGDYNVVFSGAKLSQPVNYTLKIAGGNVKLDVIKTASGERVNSW